MSAVETFDELKLIEPLARAVRDEGYTRPTAIQAAAIPHVLAGRDLLGLAQTGTGKTAAFALPILQRLAETGRRTGGDRPIAVLVLTPTRELAAQIGDSFAAYGRHLRFRHTVVFGGVSQNAQERAIRAGVDILVATPGRLLDLISQRVIFLSRLEIFVLDEADRMLDMGFVHDVRRVIALLPPKRQTLFFSATMPPEAQKLADALLTRPASVAVTPVSSTVDSVEQYVYFVEKGDKRRLLTHLLADRRVVRALVFSRTKHGADRVTRHLDDANISAAAIHGNKSQNARERALDRFKRGESRVLVATDIAARGIDIDEISHVINFDLPNVPETYVHRIGRTARAGASGVAWSFCDVEEREFLRDIERLIRRQVTVVEDHPFKSAVPISAPASKRQTEAVQPSGSGGGRSGSHHARPGGQQGGHTSERGGSHSGARSGSHPGQRPSSGSHPGQRPSSGSTPGQRPSSGSPPGPRPGGRSRRRRWR